MSSNFWEHKLLSLSTIIKEMSAILYRHIIKRKFKLSTMKIIAIFLLFLLIQKSIGFDEIDSNVWRWRDHRRRCHGRLNLYKDSENHMRYVAIFFVNHYMNIIFLIHFTGTTKLRIYCIPTPKESSKPKLRVLVAGKSTKDLASSVTIKLFDQDLKCNMWKSKMSKVSKNMIVIKKHYDLWVTFPESSYLQISKM